MQRIAYCLTVIAILCAIKSVSSFKFCDDLSSCSECISEKSWWLGQSCRWCRKNNQCHAYMSMRNPCVESEILHDQVKDWQKLCSFPLFSSYRYDPELSYKALAASTATYFWPSLCLTLLIPQSQFDVISEYSVKCHWLDTNLCEAYIAASHTERTVIVAFRGSITWSQIFAQLTGTLNIIKTKFIEEGRVQDYYYKAFMRLWNFGLERDIIQMREKYPEYKFLVTGHSLGGALASLASLWMAYYNHISPSQLYLYTFGAPRAGDVEYATIHGRYVTNNIRVVHGYDAVPHYPPRIVSFFRLAPYHHGTEVFYIDASNYNSSYKECRGKFMYNEQFECGWSHFSLRSFDVNYHTSYFNLQVGKHCRDNEKQVLHACSPYRFVF